MSGDGRPLISGLRGKVSKIVVPENTFQAILSLEFYIS